MREAKDEVNLVQSELNMKIIELQLKLQPTTPPEIREQRGDAIKEGMAIVDAIVTNYTTSFEKAMELVTNL